MKLTPEQKARHREGLRRYHASRTPEERKAAMVKASLVKRKKRNIPLPGRLTGTMWRVEDDDEL